MAIVDFLRRLINRHRPATTGLTGNALEAAERAAAQQRLRELAEAERGRQERYWTNVPTMPYARPVTPLSQQIGYRTGRQ